jgi:NAD(P)-dependent dehydrogenase (short-subunit alcohol dehydrogenase family)
MGSDILSKEVSRKEFIIHSGKALLAGALMLSPMGTLIAKASAAPAGATVLITGTSTGFGHQMARVFAQAGWVTYASMRDPNGRNAERAQSLRDFASRYQLKLKVIELDVTRVDHARAAVDTVISEQGRIDVLINNAGVFCYSPIEVVPRALWELQMATNVFGPMELTGLVLPEMRKQGSGLVIQVSSRVGRVLIPGISLYSSSKFALETATEAIHYESTPQGIDFAIIQPTAYGTDVNRNAKRIYSNFTRPLIEKERPQGAAFHREFLEKLNRDFSGNPTRNPREVAELALRIAETPRAQRILRYPIGDEGEVAPLRQINAFTARVQRDALRDSGYASWYRD